MKNITRSFELTEDELLELYTGEDALEESIPGDYEVNTYKVSDRAKIAIVIEALTKFNENDIVDYVEKFISEHRDLLWEIVKKDLD